MKRMISVLLACCMMAAVTGCGTTEDAVQNQTQAEKEQQENEQNPSENENAQTDGKTLVVYYSATGNTETVAGYLADPLGADLFEITPVQPYTADDLNWSDDTSRVSREHEDASLRTVELEQDTVEHWEEYDTVFIGYPIWWGIAAWPVDGFVTANDFTDKTVIPFCTSSSSDLGESGELLAEMAGTGDWQEGMRFRSGASAEDVQGWLESWEQ